MENLFYSALGKKARRPGQVHLSDDHASLGDLTEKDFQLISDRDIIVAYCNDLRTILDKNDLNEIIEIIFSVQNSVNALLETRMESDGLPDMGVFFKNLSPLLLQALWENTHMEDEFDRLFKRWKEAIRIAIEEELYVREEYLLEKIR